MKTSYILLAILTLVTLTGMVAIDVLLKQQYNQIDWRNPYQSFEKRTLPASRHWVIEGAPDVEIIVLESIDSLQALVAPDYVKNYRILHRGDTAVVKFTHDYVGSPGEPRATADYELPVRLVLRVPKLQTLRVKDGRVTLSGLKKDSLRITLQNSRLRTIGVGISDSISLIAGQNSFVVFGPTDQYKALKAVVQDSSGIQLNNTQVDALTLKASPKAEIQLRGRALTWVK